MSLMRAQLLYTIVSSLYVLPTFVSLLTQSVRYSRATTSLTGFLTEKHLKVVNRVFSNAHWFLFDSIVEFNISVAEPVPKTHDLTGEYLLPRKFAY